MRSPSCIADCMFHVMGPTMHAGGRIVSGIGLEDGRSKRRDNESAFTFFFPGMLVTVKWKRVKNIAQRACRGFSLLALLRYSRLRWSVSIRKRWLAPNDATPQLPVSLREVPGSQRHNSSQQMMASLRRKHMDAPWGATHSQRENRSYPNLGCIHLQDKRQCRIRLPQDSG